MANVKQEVFEEKPSIQALELQGISPDFTVDSTEENSSICPYSNQNGIEDVRKFHILDETEDSDSDKSLSYDSDIPDEEIDKMLEDALVNNKRKASQAGLGNKNPIFYYSYFK